ncbi:hypothetical protein Hanom_Chr15g01391911 [Helianthus anomalus]
MVAMAVRFQAMVVGHHRGCRLCRLPPLPNSHQPPPTPPSSDQHLARSTSATDQPPDLWFLEDDTLKMKLVNNFNIERVER